ncbi:MAG TPA: hypothetical protein PK743_09420 [Luteimonas sp.]|nr:hypothetical protein [Luteimonas sp.]HRO27949.1 hypothetical protein [Luteimonas sp.]HRP72839.1 hypothetical protein [Luteimonas sp.]
MQTIHGSGTTTGARHGDLFKAALVAAATFLLWRAARGVKGMAWTAFGLAMAAYWTGIRPW